MLDVFFYEAFEEEAAGLRRLLPERISAEFASETIQETGHAAPPARLISIRTQSKVPREWAPQLSAILARSTGYDHLLAYAAQMEQPPALGYLPLYCQRAVAEQAMLMWMALLRWLPRQMRQFQDFRRSGLTGRECAGRTLVVVGVGTIGHEICTIGAALGMRVLGVDIAPCHANIQYASIDEALPQADVLVCAMNLTEANRGYFDMAKWQRVKRGAIFVNISRGELSPSVALHEALQAGLLGGVGLDVFDQEATLAADLRCHSPTADPEVFHRMLNNPEIQATCALARRVDCICTPHNAFNTVEAVERKCEHSVQQILAYLEHGAFLWSPTT
jgi:D-lactate dehydrogenase